MKKGRKYRLFAIECSLENVEYASDFRFSRITPEYILVYVQRKRLNPPTGMSVEVREQDVKMLSKKDESWLFDCVVSLFADIAASKDRDTMERLTDMVNRFEQELEKEEGREREDGSE